MVIKFEIFESLVRKKYMISNDMFFMSDLFYYLKIDIQYPEDSIVLATNPYDVNTIEFIKEVLLGKNVVFKSINKPKNNPIIRGTVEDVDQLAYQDEFYIRIKIKDDKLDWHIIPNYDAIFIEDYDADKKPLHKEVELKKEAENYNL